VRRVSTVRLLLLSFIICSSCQLGYGKASNVYNSVQQVATVSVAPASVIVQVNQSFTIDIAITGVVDLYGWEFQLGWNSSLLAVLDVSEGQFLKAGGTTYFASNVNDTAGNLIVDCTLTGNVPGVSGDGTLASITFNVSDVGECALNLHDVELADSSDNSIPCQATGGNGYFSSPEAYVAVTVNPSKTVVGQGYSVSITVVVEDYGNFSETFDTVIYINTTAVNTQNVNLQSGTPAAISYTWDTGSYAKAIYIISASAEPISGGTNTTNNTYMTGPVEVTIPGDLNGDFKVNLEDLVQLALAYGSTPGDPNWNPTADIDNSGVVGLSDLVILALHYGQQYP
jgi:hypothetical protein